MATNDGGPAYPHTYHDTNMAGEPLYEEWSGMSLRDWFAGMICNGLVTATAHTEAKDFIEPEASEVIARFSYDMADHMLNARNR